MGRLRQRSVRIEDEALHRNGQAHWGLIDFRGTMRLCLERFAQALLAAQAGSARQLRHRMTTLRLPVELPPHWFAEDDWRGTIIHAADKHGRILASVTVNEDVRGYLLGVQQVPAFHGKAQRYMRRNWRTRLYRDALAALMLAWPG